MCVPLPWQRSFGSWLEVAACKGIFGKLGLAEVPVIVILLVKFGAVTVEKLKEARPYVIVGAFVVAAVVTPPDVVSQFMLAVPMWLLFELGLLLSRFIAKPTSMEAASDYQPPSDEEMERELDRAAEESQRNRHG
jgi:sec-independent protein translocase protein TatC